MQVRVGLRCAASAISEKFDSYSWFYNHQFILGLFHSHFGLLPSFHRALSENGSLIVPFVHAWLKFSIVFHAGKSGAQICNNNYRHLLLWCLYYFQYSYISFRHLCSVSISYPLSDFYRVPSGNDNLFSTNTAVIKRVSNHETHQRTVYDSLSTSRLTNCTLFDNRTNQKWNLESQNCFHKQIIVLVIVWVVVNFVKCSILLW